MRLWDLRQGKLLFTLQGHKGSVNSVAFSPDGEYISSGGLDQVLVLWKSNLNNDTIPQSKTLNHASTITDKKVRTSSAPAKIR